MAYAIIFSLTLLILSIFKNRNDSHRIYSKPQYDSIIIILVLFCALRSLDVGADTRVYFYHFNSVKNLSIVEVITNNKVDTGFYIFTWVISKCIGSFQIYLVIIEALYIIPVIELIRHKSVSPVFSLFLFYCMGLYTFSFSTIRQTLAMSFCLMAYFFKDNRKIRSIILFALGVTFHYSSIIFLPYIFINKLVITKKKIGFLCALLFLAYFVSDKIIPLFLAVVNFTGSNKEYRIVSTGGWGMVGFLFFAFLLGAYLLINSTEDVRKELSQDVILLYFALFVFIISRFNLGVMRLYYYYFFFSVTAIPNITSCIKIKRNRLLIQLLFIFVAVYFLFSNVFSDPYAVSKKLLPYRFFWSD